MTRQPGAVTYKHSSDAVRFRTFTGNMYEALDLLETYRRDHSALVTSRLHCYLPMRSIGAQVDFRPKNRSDIRFAGLIDINDDQFDAIRSGINDRLERIFAAIMEGGSREEVYGLWRELCARRCRARPREACCSPCGGCADDRCQRRDPASDRGRRTRGPTSPGDAVHVAIRVDESRSRPLNVLVESLVLQASRPLHLWLLDGTEEGVDLDEVALRAERQHHHGDSHQGPGRRPPRAQHGGSQQVPVWLRRADAPRVAALTSTESSCLPLDALVEGDVAALADIDLAGQALAAPDVAGEHRGERLRCDPQCRQSPEHPDNGSHGSCGAERTRDTRSTSRPSTSMCWSWTSSDCARRSGARGGAARRGVRPGCPRGAALPCRA